MMAMLCRREVVWHTEDIFGRYVANGLYLYRVWVRVEGAWVLCAPGKVVILR
ncbi:MAG: hypothetical protein ABDI20_05345 [Candidatus Bipolaricaulaceae bacterium]